MFLENSVQLIYQIALTAEVQRNSQVTEAASLNCSPQDLFKLSAQEPLLKSQRRKVMNRDGDQRGAQELHNTHWPLYCVYVHRV